MIAIIIPFYKLTFFEATLTSLANQSDKHFKVYIGDDCSPENPTDLLEKYNGKIDFVYHRFENNLGGNDLVKQWERCMDLSHNEEWLMLLGDDDVLGENVIEEFYLHIHNNKDVKIDLVRFKLEIIDKNGVIEKNEFVYNQFESAEQLLQRMFSKFETITASEFVFSRNVYLKNNGFVNFPLAWFSDYATWLSFGKNSKIYNIKSANVYWRLSDINISSQSKSNKQISLKVKSLFLFISFVIKNFKVQTIVKKTYIFEHLNYLFYEIKFLEILKILVSEIFKSKFKFAPIIFSFLLFRTKKNMLIKFQKYESFYTS
jgi:glycosyltransferase involved in cell wall biosynthesis